MANGVWEPLRDVDILIAGEEGMGKSCKCTKIEATSAARGAAFEERKHKLRHEEMLSGGSWAPVEDFGTRYKLSCRAEGDEDFEAPDLNNAVSTLVVRSMKPAGRQHFVPTKYWLRRVRVITLAEVLDNCKHDESFYFIYDCWLEGQAVFRGGGMRGVAGGRKRK